MLSICLPVYNFNITGLVMELSRQAERLNLPYEIIVIDDRSDDLFRTLNSEACINLRYIQLDKNIGRSRIRNLFREQASYENLLFLDCDSMITSPLFVAGYLEAAGKYENTVICGGRQYPGIPPDRSLKLRWKYGISRENKPVNDRQSSPYQSFMSNNFLIPKKVFTQVRFDEELSGYGYEDTLLGFDLMQKNIPVIHIDNPVMNGQIDNNRQYLKNAEDGIKNLVSILRRRNYDIEFINYIKLLRYTFTSLKGIGHLLIKGLFILSKSLIKGMLSHGFVSLRLFDFYKLGTLLLLLETDKQKTVSLTSHYQRPG